MWTRVELKTRAKNVLRTNYWKALLIALIVAVAGGMDGRFAGNGRGHKGNGMDGISGMMGLNGNTTPQGGEGFLWHLNGGWGILDPGFWVFLATILTIVIIVAVLALALRVLLGFPAEVGGKRYFVKSSVFENGEGSIAYAFDRANYRNIVITMFAMKILNFFWYLLLIIPGIIKSYAYRMVPYILAENPGIEARRAIELSDQMTKGHKWDMFVLDLSFIGWYFLGLLAMGIGIIFVMPYELATKAELYQVLKRTALEAGICGREEFGQVEQQF